MRTALCCLLLFLIAGCSILRPDRTPAAPEVPSEAIEQESMLARVDTVSSDSGYAAVPDTTVRADSAAAADTVAAQEPEEEIAPARTDTVIIDSLMAKMTLREKIGQLFFISATGRFQPQDEESYRRLVNRIREYRPGGLIFFSGSVYGQAMMTNRLQSASDIPLWITQDMEYGAAMRVSGTTRIVPAMGIAATGNPEYAWWAGKITAREAKALGVHQIFAPVLDVNNNPENPVINVRSFSGSPETVAAYGNRFIDGVASEGMVATAKHFPGHGDTDVDSHIALPVINFGYSRLDSVELAPFRAAIGNGLKSVMSAHIAYPEISDNPDLPATLDPSILNRILIDSLGFGGLVITDGLEMSGITSHFSPGEAVVMSLRAGADLMLLSPDEITAIDEVEMAVIRGKLQEERIDRSVRKLLQWKKEHGLFEQRQVDIEALDRLVNPMEHRLIAQEISRKSITVVKNEGGILPIRSAEYPRVMVLSVADDESGQTGSFLGTMMREYHPFVTSHVLDSRSSEEEKQRILRDARSADLIVIGSFIYVRSGQPVQLTDEHRAFLGRLPDKPSVLIAFGNPYVVEDLPDAEVHVMAWSASGEQIRSAVPVLFGGASAEGRLPMKIPGMYAHGEGIILPQTALRYDEPETVGLSSDSLFAMERIMREAVADSTFPGGTVTVVKDGVIAYQDGFGYHTYEKVRPVDGSDIYDLASLTKVVSTTAAVMKLVNEGELSLDDPVSRYVDTFAAGPRGEVTIRNLLLHNSGLPAFRVYVDEITERGRLLEAIRNEPLIHDPGTTYEYSDLGFILLSEIVERITEMPIDEFVQQAFYYPMGMSATRFNPSDLGTWFTRRIPPTEIDTVYRRKRIIAEVNDERAWYLEGVAGHAGLFSSGPDLAAFAQMLLNGGTYAGKRYLEESTVALFTSKQSPQNNRGFGFDRKSGERSTAGTLTSMSTFGHLGFTGTSIWIDPERDLAVIILTNRTFPHRSYGGNISRVRTAVADAVVRAITEE